MSVNQNRFRDTSTAHIMEELECWRWDFAEILSDPEWTEQREQNAAFAMVIITEAEDELARRERLRTSVDPNVRWPELGKEARRYNLTRIKQDFPLKEFIEQHTPEWFTRHGDEWVTHCMLPGHDDSSPSFYVNDQKQVFKCFGCNRQGDIFDFVRHFFSISTFRDAAALLVEWSGGELDCEKDHRMVHSRIVPLRESFGNESNLPITKPKRNDSTRPQFEVRDGEVRPR